LKIYALAVPEPLVKRVHAALEAAGLTVPDRPTQYLGLVPRQWLDVVDASFEDFVVMLGLRK